jgi:hypothetical protein
VGSHSEYISFGQRIADDAGIAPNAGIDHDARIAIDGSSELKLDLIDIAPSPVLARFQGPYDRVLDSMEVFRRMLVFGIIATADVSARHAKAEMDPRVAHFQAVLTSARARRDIVDLIEMRTFSHGRCIEKVMVAAIIVRNRFEP